MNVGDWVSRGVVLLSTVLLAAAVAAQEPAADADADAGAAAAETAPPAAKTEADEIAAVVRQADALYAKREAAFSGENIDQCVALLEEAVKKYPGRYALLWRLGRAYFWKADGAPNDDVKSEWGKKAMQYGDYARTVNPDDVKGWYFAAVGVGAYSQGMGILTALTKGMEGKFNERLDKAIALDPNYDCGGPLNAKGRYYYELPWPKYSGKKSIEWLQKALKVCPDNARTMFYLAETYLKEDEDAKAKQMVDRGLSIRPESFEDPPDTRRAQIWLRALQKKMKQ